MNVNRFKMLSLIVIISFIMAGCAPAAAVTAQPAPAIPTSEQPQGTTAEPETQKEIPLIFSHDGAPDDISAMLYVSKVPQIKILGVVMSYGEQHPNIAINKWASFLYEVLDLDTVPIAAGSERPVDLVVNEFPSGWRDAADTFMGLELPATKQAIDTRSGAQLIIDLVKASPEKVTLLVTGAQTDVALALQADPTIKENISQIVVMGGAFHMDGNLGGYVPANKAAEWNIYVDPLGAKQVFNAGIPLTIVPLDGSDDFWISRAMHFNLQNSKDAGVQLIAKAWEIQFGWWNGDFKIWDIVAAAAVVHPELFEWEYGKLDVIAEAGDQHGRTFVAGKDSINRFAVGCTYYELRENVLNTFLKK